jgi:hypothetical protein
VDYFCWWMVLKQANLTRLSLDEIPYVWIESLLLWIRLLGWDGVWCFTSWDTYDVTTLNGWVAQSTNNGWMNTIWWHWEAELLGYSKDSAGW